MMQWSPIQYNLNYSLYQQICYRVIHSYVLKISHLRHKEIPELSNRMRVEENETIVEART